MKKKKAVKKAAIKSNSLQSELSKSLVAEIRKIWESARASAARSVDTTHVAANWLIGREIVEAQQKGQRRAGYGNELLQYLSDSLTAEYGNGFSVSSLRYMRQFYGEYPRLLEIHHPVGDEFRNAKAKRPGTGLSKASQKHHPVGDDFSPKNEWAPGRLHSSLSWRHYRCLIKVDNSEARSFYEIEAIKNNWSGRELERQVNSLLFFRLLKSRDKKGVMSLANKGNPVTKPVDIIKDPFVLEFLDLPESPALSETQLEAALITKLKDFLLELGQGFAYVGRQKRLTLDGDHFYSDLVFYHIRLKCYVVIDLKTAKLTHGDLGQMLMYVNFYDREIRTRDENPTIGLILCTDKNDAMAEYVLSEKNRRIFASRYQHELPTVDQLKTELRREVALIAASPVRNEDTMKNPQKRTKSAIVMRRKKRG